MAFKVFVMLALVAIGLFAFLLYKSKALSYLSSDPKACINCHVMNPQYATWQHSSHKDVLCIECHLPRDSFIGKYAAKARDGYNHSVAFTFDTYKHAIKISEDGARRVQENCVSCHKTIVSKLVASNDANHNFQDPNYASGRKCWECHKSVPHGKVRSLTSAPNNLGVKELK